MYEDVVREFYSRYDLPEDVHYTTLRFVKEKTGYSVEEFNYDSGLYHKKQLFWNAGSGEYLDLSFPPGKEEENFVSQICEDWHAFQFDLNPYYGYVGWEKDVIDYYKVKTDLSDDELYALARAWSIAASNLINNNSGYADTSSIFKTQESGSNQLNQKQLEEYRFKRHKAIELFGTLCARTPDYQTIVGTICNKYHNEFVTAFLDLRMYQNEEEAMKELPDGLFDDFWLDMSRNYLEACDSNAILFTNGDNDTYTLLYLQAKLGFRRDVLVANLSLLNTARYTNNLRHEKVLDADPLTMVLLPQTYAAGNLPYCIVDQQNDKPDTKSVSEVLKGINDRILQTEEPEKGGNVCHIPKNLLFNTSSSTFEITLGDSWLSRGDMFTLDILQSCIGKRPVFFVYNNVEKIGLQDHLELTGPCYRFVESLTSDYTHLDLSGINPAKTYDLLMNRFHFNSSATEGSKVNKIVRHGYQSAFCHLAGYYHSVSQPDSSAAVINRYLEYFPPQAYPMDYTSVPMIVIAYRVFLKDQGDMMTTSLIETLEKLSMSASLNPVDLQTLAYAVETLTIWVENPDLLKRLKALSTEE